MIRARKLTIATVIVALGGAIAALAGAGSDACYACTTARHTGAHGTVVAKSYDWHSDGGLIFFNPPHVKKQALLIDGSTPLTWRSNFGSLTFNQYGRELPNGGMNTAGLVVEIMWLRETQTPGVDARPAVNELQWIQYQLDRFSSVDEVVEHSAQIRVAPIHGTVHYLACDRSGDCAAFDYVDGKLEVHHGESLVAPVLTNSTYATSAKYLESPASKSAVGQGSLARFARAAKRSVELAGKATVQDAFATLDDVSMGDYSVWNIVYQPTTQRVYFRTRRAPAIKFIDLGPLAQVARCGGPVPMLDLHQEMAGDATPRFTKATDVANDALVRQTISELGGALDGPLGQALSKRLTALPRSFSCAVQR